MNKQSVPTIKPKPIRQRIQITPTARTRAILEEYKALTGKSMGGMISELLDDSATVLEQVLELHRKFKEKPTLMRESLLEFAQAGHQQISDIEQKTMDLFKPKRGRKRKSEGSQ